MSDALPAPLPSSLAWTPPPGLTPADRRFTMLGTMLGLLLAALDQTIVATAGPAIQQDLGISPGLYAWLTTSYLVASTATVPLYGKLSDLLGRKAILLTGIVIFILGSLLCAIAPTSLTLILARAVQGLGSAALFTSAFAVVGDLFPPAERGKYQGLFSAVFGLSSVVGPLAGGAITDAFGWHWVFLINVPLGALATLLIVLRMPALRVQRHGPRQPLDVAGAVLLIAAVVPLLLGLSLVHPEGSVPGEGQGWGSPLILGLLGSALTFGVCFVWRERRAADPLLDLRLFGNRTFALANAANFLLGATFLSSIVFLPLFMVNVVGLSATGSGLTVTPLTLGIVAGNIASGQIVARLGRYKGLMLGSGLLLMSAFLIMALTLDAEATQASVTLKMVLVGIGLGPSMPLYTLAVQSSVPMRQLGVATSTATFARNLGSTMGVAVMGTVFASSLASSAARRLATSAGLTAEQLARRAAEDFAAAIAGIYWWNTCLVVAGLALTLLLPSVHLARTRASSPPKDAAVV